MKTNDKLARLRNLANSTTPESVAIIEAELVAAAKERVSHG
jgi:hypothetical protein